VWTICNKEISMAAVSGRLKWSRLVVAVVLAEVLPILVLVAVVFAYSLTPASRQPGALSPEAFAPVAGNWVGPIAGFLATLLFAWWAARRAGERPLAHGIAVGVGTALLDLGLGLLLGGAGEVHPLLLVSNSGRILAGLLGGGLASRRG